MTFPVLSIIYHGPHGNRAEQQRKKEEIIPQKEGQLLFLGLYPFLHCIFFDIWLSLQLLGEFYPSLQRRPHFKNSHWRPPPFMATRNGGWSQFFVRFVFICLLLCDNFICLFFYLILVHLFQVWFNASWRQLHHIFRSSLCFQHGQFSNQFFSTWKLQQPIFFNLKNSATNFFQLEKNSNQFFSTLKLQQPIFFQPENSATIFFNLKNPANNYEQLEQINNCQIQNLILKYLTRVEYIVEHCNM